MEERKQGGLKICVLEARIIRHDVKKSLQNHGRVPKAVSVYLRSRARKDAESHIFINPSFSHGGGPAVKKYT